MGSQKGVSAWNTDVMVVSVMANLKKQSTKDVHVQHARALQGAEARAIRFLSLETSVSVAVLNATKSESRHRSRHARSLEFRRILRFLYRRQSTLGGPFARRCCTESRNCAAAILLIRTVTIDSP